MMDNGERLYYDKYRELYKDFMRQIDLNYTTHETRYTVRSEFDRLLDKGQVSKVCVNKILGHKSGEVGEDVYTQKTLEELKNTIELLDYRKKKSQKIVYLRTANSF